MLKAKKPTIENKLSKTLSEDRVTRKIIVTDDLFKQIKLVSLESDQSLYELLNNALIANIDEKLEMVIGADCYEGEYRNFAMDSLIFKKTKKHCVENDISLKAFLHTSLLSILSS